MSYNYNSLNFIPLKLFYKTIINFSHTLFILFISLSDKDFLVSFLINFYKILIIYKKKL